MARRRSRGWSLEVAPAPRKAAGRKNNNENQAAISNHPAAFVSSPFAILSLCLLEVPSKSCEQKWENEITFPISQENVPIYVPFMFPRNPCSLETATALWFSGKEDINLQAFISIKACKGFAGPGAVMGGNSHLGCAVFGVFFCSPKSRRCSY